MGHYINKCLLGRRHSGNVVNFILIMYTRNAYEFCSVNVARGIVSPS